jgi:hypothetical protein
MFNLYAYLFEGPVFIVTTLRIMFNSIKLEGLHGVILLILILRTFRNIGILLPVGANILTFFSKRSLTGKRWNRYLF